jgi:two-component system, NtrC family, sensor histidine kinase KinB
MIVENETQRWRVLYEIARDLYQYDPLDLGRLLQGVLEKIGQHTSLRMGCIVTFHENDQVNEAYTLDLDAFGAGLWEHLFNHGLMGFVHHSQRTIVIRNIQNDVRWSQLPPNVSAPREGAAIGMPITIADKPLGVMLFVHDEIDAFTEESRMMLEEIRQLVARAASNERVRREEQTTSERYQWLFEDAITPVIITEMRGQIISANREACRLLRYDEAQLKTMNVRDIHQSRSKQRENGRTSSSLQTNMLSAFDTTMQAADGETIPVRLKMRKRHFRNNPVIEYVMQDARTEVQLNQLRSDLTAMVFHDLRAPLQNIKFSLAALQRLLPDTPAAQQAFVTSQSSTTQLQRMISSLLDIQRLEGSDTIIHPKVVTVERIVSPAIEQTSAIVQAAGLDLSLQIDDNLPTLYVDPDMMRRVLTNLVENATKYAADGGMITLNLTADDEFVYMCVKDDGPGIDPQMRQQIFEKFSRVKYKDVPHGVGLGLAFCKLAVEAHGGRIWVESEVGQGAEFHFTVPVNKQESVTGRG